MGDYLLPGPSRAVLYRGQLMHGLLSQRLVEALAAGGQYFDRLIAFAGSARSEDDRVMIVAKRELNGLGLAEDDAARASEAWQAMAAGATSAGKLDSRIEIIRLSSRQIGPDGS